MHAQIKNAAKLIKEGLIENAANIFEEIRGITTDEIDAIIQRGRLALQLDENIYALESFSKAVELQPANYYYLYLLASTHAKMGEIDTAEELCLEVIKNDPNHHEPYIMLGMCAKEKGEFAKAADYLRKAVQLEPTALAAYADLIFSLRMVRQHDEALGFAEQLLQLDPDNANNYLPISRVLIEQGKSEKAIPYLQKAIQTDSTCGEAYYALTAVKKFLIEDVNLHNKANEALQKGLPAQSRSRIHFSLGKMFNDCGQWDKAFEEYRQGNLLGKPAAEPTWLAERCKTAKKIYNRAFINQTERYGSDSDVPVFIVGMPRSGTTLMEQIIASHPDADGAGELSEIARIHRCITSAENKTELHKNLSRESLAEYAGSYLKMLRNGRESAKRVVDKQPHNFACLGLMHKLFPNAHFIHARRNPLDTCLSCYFQAFQFLPQTYDLEWVGNIYRIYRETMEHWKKLLPEGRILEVDYENVVQDTEAEARQIIDFCQLPWDDQCLEFYKASRPVITASQWQTRQPIYSSSKQRWVNYARHLGPLVNQISEYLDDEDIAELEKQGVKVKKKWGLGFLKSARN